MVKALLFDLDGTITAPKVGITKSVQYALEAFGIIASDADRRRPFIGPPLQESFEQFYQMSKEQAKQAVEKYRERFSTVGLYENEIYPGMAQLLSELCAQGCTLAVASSKPTVVVRGVLGSFRVEGEWGGGVGGGGGGRAFLQKILKLAVLTHYMLHRLTIQEIWVIQSLPWEHSHTDLWVLILKK